MNLVRAPDQRPGHGQRRGLRRFVQRHLRDLRRGPGANRHLAERDLVGVEDHARRRFSHRDPDGFAALEPLARQIHDEFQVVVGRRNGRRKSLREGG